mmetsp:Transcript_120038/g.179344  ORF Transcript_120038/g.179344 Transcript_120038/m.179344 type:complete len:113 (-) Transcript_120038:7-345(-)
MGLFPFTLSDIMLTPCVAALDVNMLVLVTASSANSPSTATLRAPPFGTPRDILFDFESAANAKLLLLGMQVKRILIHAFAVLMVIYCWLVSRCFSRSGGRQLESFLFLFPKL